MNPYVKVSLLLVVAAAGLTLAAASFGGPPQTGPFAAGDGMVANRTFEFGAARPKTGGEISGRAILRWNLHPRGMVELRVTCLEISGSTATVGGKVVRRTGRRVAKRFRSATFFVEDGRASGQPDRMGALRLSKRPSAKCPQPSSTNLTQVRSGDIAVDDAKP